MFVAGTWVLIECQLC